MARICLCLTGKTLAQDLKILDENRKYVDIAELRVDCLDPDERFLIRSFPEMAGLPVILSIRRVIDGGSFTGGDGTRITLLAKGLAYADANRRRNFAYVELEEDLDVPSLEEAARTYGTRIIRSWHNKEGVDEDLAEKFRKLRRVGDELIKASFAPRSLDEVYKIYRAAKDTKDVEKVIHSMGPYGINTSILAEILGSQISYVYPDPALEGIDLPPREACQLEPKELVEKFRFRNINAETKVFAVSGNPLNNNEVPRFFNTIFDIEHIDAVYIPAQADSVHSLMRLAEICGISGISISSPFYEDILPYLSNISKEVDNIGSCNTIVSDPQGWAGYNTGAAGFTDSLLAFYGRNDLKGRKVSIIGARGIGKVVASEVHRLRGKALILNRTPAYARRLAENYKFAWAGLDSRGADLMMKYSDIIIQASPVGMYPDVDADPIESYEFSGRETVMDLIYNPEKTCFLKRAEAAGCRTLNGYDMLHRQLRYQYRHFINKEFPPSLVSRVGL